MALSGSYYLFYARWIPHDSISAFTPHANSRILTPRFMAKKTTSTAAQDRYSDGMVPNSSRKKESVGTLLTYLVLGTLFGIIFVKAEIISWFRIQEMFRLQSFHMYGVIGSAVLTGMISIQVIKRFRLKSLQGETVVIPTKPFRKGQPIGGFIFGLGWAITGACPGPLFAQIGSGYTVVLVTLISALAGTWVYGRFEKYFPN